MSLDTSFERSHAAPNTMTTKKDKVPERIWLTEFEDDRDPPFVMETWQSPVVRNTQPGDFVATRPHRKVPYIPESLLATRVKEARAEAWKNAIAVAKGELWEETGAEYGPHRAEQNSVINCVTDALETALEAEAAADTGNKLTTNSTKRVSLKLVASNPSPSQNAPNDPWQCCDGFGAAEDQGAIIATEAGYVLCFYSGENESGIVGDISFCPFCAARLPQPKDHQTGSQA